MVAGLQTGERRGEDGRVSELPEATWTEAPGEREQPTC